MEQQTGHENICSPALFFSRFQELFLENSFAKIPGASGCILCQVHCHLLKDRVQAAEVREAHQMPCNIAASHCQLMVPNGSDMSWMTLDDLG